MDPNKVLDLATSIITALASGATATDLTLDIQRLGNMAQFSSVASDENRREGFAAVAGMMKKTSATVAVICARVDALVLALPTASGSTITAIHTELGVLGTLLERVGRIAPIGPWGMPSA